MQKPIYTLSEKAADDLESILDYSYSNFGVAVMQDYYDSLESCFYTLVKNPDLGLRVKHISPDYHCFHHRSHLIFYQKSKQGVFIVRLLHQSMDAPQHFKNE